MAGKKGMKGGGGARPGAGRKPNPDTPSKKAAKSVLIVAGDMLEMLEQVALGKTEATSLQVRAAIAAVQYRHQKNGKGGKKDASKEAADAAGRGKYAPTASPRLVAVR